MFNLESTEIEALRLAISYLLVAGSKSSVKLTSSESEALKSVQTKLNQNW